MTRGFVFTLFLLLIFAATNHAEPFIDGGNGTVTDKATDLIWQITDDGIPRTWQEALDYCNGLTLDGNSDWRLPNIKELESIVDDLTFGPATAPVFSAKSARYWSATSNAMFAVNAWHVDFSHGDVGYNHWTLNYYVRCVR